MDLADKPFDFSGAYTWTGLQTFNTGVTIGDNDNLTINSGSKIVVDDTTNSTSTTTGSIQTDGGLGVVKSIYSGDINTINNSGLTPANAIFAGTLHRIVGVAAANAAASIEAFGGIAQTITRASQGTAAAPTATQSSNILWRHIAQGYGTTSYFNNAQARFVASETFTDSAQGTRYEILLTPIGATGGAIVLTLSDVGDLVLNSTTNSTSSTTGAIQTAGGAYIAKNLLAVKGLGLGVTSTVTAAGTTTLTNASTSIQTFTGSTTQTIQFPAANLFGTGIAVVYTINNQSSGTVTPTRAGSDTFQGGGTTDPVLAGASMTYASDGASVWMKI